MVVLIIYSNFGLSKNFIYKNEIIRDMRKTILALLLACTTLVVPAQSLKQSVVTGVETSIRQSENHLWREAFTTCRNLDAMIGAGNPDLHYLVAKERFRLYFRIHKTVECKAQLALMEQYARASKQNAVIEDMLMKKAGFARTSGNITLATNCYKEIFTMRSAGKDDNGKEKCFKDLLAVAKQSNDPAMASVVKRMYEQWTDSISDIRAAKELTDMKQQYAAAQEEISSKDTKITAQWAFIVILIIIAAALGVGLAFFILLMLKNRREIKRLKNSLQLSDSNNERKNKFLNNISAQLRPSLNAIAQGNSKQHIASLQNYMDHIEIYMALEQSRDQHYELTSQKMGQLCEKLKEETKTLVSANTKVTCDCQPISFATNAEALCTLAMGIVGEAIKCDTLERITFEFKKRNPHTGQFIVTVVGMLLPEEKRTNLFQAFAEVVDLTKDDGLTYPTCSLIAYKLNAHLHLDEEYKHGTRFVVDMKDEACS